MLQPSTIDKIPLEELFHIAHSIKTLVKPSEAQYFDAPVRS